MSALRVGISACLLGQEVRYDGGHKHDVFLEELLRPYVEWVPVCPEVELGMGTPRDTIRLERRGGEIRLIMPKSGADYTVEMEAYAEKRVADLEEADLDGYILKKDSPSCGMERVRVYEASGIPNRSGTGLFAETLMRRLPHLPVEEEGRVRDARLRENFVSRMFSWQRWKRMRAQGITRAALMRFHQQHKLLLMAHNQRGAARLGRLLGEAGRLRAQELARSYLERFTEVMQRAPTARQHANVLQHLAGYVSKSLDVGDRRELTETIDQYRRGLLPLIVPITLLRHYVRKFRTPYLDDQVYLNPHPQELRLLNQL